MEVSREMAVTIGRAIVQMSGGVSLSCMKETNSSAAWGLSGEGDLDVRGVVAGGRLPGRTWHGCVRAWWPPDWLGKWPCTLLRQGLRESCLGLAGLVSMRSGGTASMEKGPLA